MIKYCNPSLDIRINRKQMAETFCSMKRKS